MIDVEYMKKYEPIDGKWYVARELGRGAFGTVFEIERKDFGDIKAALKVVSIPASQAEINSYRDENYDLDEKSVTAYFYGFVEEIVKEFQLMSHLKGESHIVSYEDHDVKKHENGIGWDVFIRMELLTPINRYFAKNKPKQSDIIKLGIDICKALEVCQKYKIIHRDIKPSNIFMSKTGNFKLGDFGVARTLERTSSGLSKKGTYTYMAPEVFNGKEYGSNVDIYSLGIVLYKLLNNNLEPFRKERTYDDEENALVARMQGKKKIPKPANADGRLAEIVLKACSYDPKYRYESPLQMREELENILYTDTESKIIYPNGEEVNYEPSNSDATDKSNSENEKTTALFEDDNDLEQTETVGLFGTSQGQTKYDTFDEKTETIGFFTETHNVGRITADDSGENSDNNKPITNVDKKKNKFAIIITMAALCLLVGIGIIVYTSRTPYIPLTDITGVPEETVQMVVGDTYELHLGYYPEDAMPKPGETVGDILFKYESSDTSIIEVSEDSSNRNGIITALAAGEATITIKCSDIVKVVTVNVSDKQIQEQTTQQPTQQPTQEQTTQQSTQKQTTQQKTQQKTQQSTQQQTTQQSTQQQTTQQQQTQQQAVCPVCGSKYHTVHPTSDAPTIDKDFD